LASEPQHFLESYLISGSRAWLLTLSFNSLTRCTLKKFAYRGTAGGALAVLSAFRDFGDAKIASFDNFEHLSAMAGQLS
jgi:hypothetical protein